MARIAGVDLPNDKRVETGLTYIYGIGDFSSKKILVEAGVAPEKRVRDLTGDEVAKLRAIIENQYQVEGDLRKLVNLSIRRLIDIGSYRGLRHRLGLPARGQRTKTNARTRKGKRSSSSAIKGKK